MSYDTGVSNESWAYTLIDQLYQLGVSYFCVAPGSRSTALALAIAKHPLVKSFVHFDERGLAFHAYGYAKASKSPVALVVTSGTAVGNLFPAVMESSLAYVPLIILTADRPPELRDCSANQTADQVKIFGDYVRWQVELPCPDPHLPENYLRSTLAQAVYRATNSPQGPVHVNCMFREPFFSSEKVKIPSLNTCVYEPTASQPPLSSITKWSGLLSTYKKGLIIVGTHAPSPDLTPIIALAEILGWPICADITSPLRSLGAQKPLIPYFDALIKARPNLKIEAVLHLGDRFVSKTLAEWICSQSDLPYFLVADHPNRYDPKHNITHRMQCDPVLFCAQILPFLVSQNSEWMDEWRQNSSLIEEELTDQFEQTKQLTEPGIVRELHSFFPSPWALFLSNSMPVRDADSFFFPSHPIGPVYVNRGLSGIDGNIATAIGMAEALNKPLVAVLGDLAFLHDLNSLAQMKKCTTPVILLVINNGGGGIFSFLPIANKEDTFEEFFAASHQITFEKGADLFDIPYFCPKNQTAWKSLFQELGQKPLSCLIEIHTQRQQNAVYHKEIHQRLKAKLCSPSPLMAV